MSSLAGGQPAPPARHPVPRAVVALVAILTGVIFLGALFELRVTSQFTWGTTLNLTAGQAARFSVVPGNYALVANTTTSSSIKPSKATLPEVTCTGTEADGSAVAITPHFQNYPPSLLPGLMGSWSYTYRVADLTITQPDPTLTCAGDWYTLTLAPRLSADLQGAASGIMLILLIGGVASGIFAISRGRRPGLARRVANGLWFAFLGVTIVAVIVYGRLPSSVNDGNQDPSMTPIPACSMDNPTVVDGDSATGLSFDKAYLIDATGLSVCVSSPQPFVVPASVAIPDGTPMALLLTTAYVHDVQLPDPSNQAGQGQSFSLSVDATSGGVTVTGIDTVLTNSADVNGALIIVNSILWPSGAANSGDPLNTQYLAYAAADPSDLDLTLTFHLTNVFDWSVTANFQLSQ